MRPGKFDGAPTGTRMLVVGYLPNFETTGQIWRDGDKLVYAQNPFALQNLKNIIRGWSGLIGLKPDDPLFFDLISHSPNLGWRWQIDETIVR